MACHTLFMMIMRIESFCIDFLTPLTSKLRSLINVWKKIVVTKPNTYTKIKRALSNNTTSSSCYVRNKVSLLYKQWLHELVYFIDLKKFRLQKHGIFFVSKFYSIFKQIANSSPTMRCSSFEMYFHYWIPIMFISTR